MNKKLKLMKPPHPSKFIHEEMWELGLDVELTAEALGVRPTTLLDLLTEEAALSPEMAMRLEKAFGLSMDILLRIQACHDGYTMRQRAGEIDVKNSLPDSRSVFQ